MLKFQSIPPYRLDVSWPAHIGYSKEADGHDKLGNVQLEPFHGKFYIYILTPINDTETFFTSSASLEVCHVSDECKHTMYAKPCHSPISVEVAMFSTSEHEASETLGRRMSGSRPKCRR